MSEIETLKSMEIHEKINGIKMNLGKFLNSVSEGGYFSYSGSLTTPGKCELNVRIQIYNSSYFYFNITNKDLIIS